MVTYTAIQKRVFWMTTKLQNMKWKLHNYKSKQLLIWGIKNGYIKPYNDNLS